MEYDEFLASKRIAQKPNGFEPQSLNPFLFDFQRDIVTWACRKGRAAIFADCGMGKTIMQLSWAEQVRNRKGGRILIVAPLAVAAQTCREGATFGIEVHKARNADELQDGINITNYELKVNGVAVDTPPKELELIYHFASNPNRVYTRDQLLDEVWGFDYYGDSRTVDVHVKRLREKLEGVSDKWELRTVWGVGYKFETKD